MPILNTSSVWKSVLIYVIYNNWLTRIGTSYVLLMTYTTDYIQVHVLKMNFWLVCITVEFYPLQK